MTCLAYLDPTGTLEDPGALARWAEVIVTMQASHYGPLLGSDAVCESVSSLLTMLSGRHHRRTLAMLALADEAPEAPEVREAPEVGEVPAAGQATEAEGPVRIDEHSTLDPARVIGCATVSISQDTPHLADDLVIVVAPAWRRQGVATALEQGVRRLAAQQGCTSIQATTLSPVARAGDPGGDLPEDLAGELVGEGHPYGPASTPGTAFVQARGYQLGLAEGAWVQDVRDPAVRALAEQSPDLPEGYRYASWRGPINREIEAWIHELRVQADDDVPIGDLESVMVNPDADTTISRSHLDAQIVDLMGAVILYDGKAAAWTQLARTYEHDDVCQWITIVGREHRGRGLAAILKRAVLAEVYREWPQARAILTETSVTNLGMQRTNERLGYQLRAVWGFWTARL